jgi:phage terminase large subunit GpA-like protein
MPGIVEKAARAVFKPADRRPPWKWCEDNYFVSPSSPMPGRWRSDNSPWVREFMEVFANDEIKTISIMCAAQSSKTETMLALLCWLIQEDPAPCMWVTSSEEEAGKFWQERMKPALEANPNINLMMPTGRTRAKEVFFPTMPLELIGANAPSKLQSKPRRWLMLDEVRNWPPGALPMVLKRTRTFWNARRVVISTPDIEHDPVHQGFLEGDQRHYYVQCPKCGHMQILEWQQMKWEVNETTRPGGKYDFDELAKTIRYECEKGCKIKDSPPVRRKLASNGEWRRHNPTAPSSRVSFTWSAMLPPWVPWRELVEEFINASKAQEWGDHEPLKAFITESLGQPWQDELRYKAERDFLSERQVKYNIREKWEDAERLFLGADVQKDKIYYVVRAFGKFGRSRLIDYDTVINFEDLIPVIEEFGVDPDDVAIDAAHRTGEVYKAIEGSGYRWKAFWGDDRHFWIKEGIRKPWTISHIDPAIGTKMEGRVRPIRLYHWSNPSIKDKLELLMRGNGPEWQIPEKISREYLKHLTAERREELVNAKNEVSFRYVKIRKDDHWRDCELEILAAATITKVLGTSLEDVHQEMLAPLNPVDTAEGS